MNGPQVDERTLELQWSNSQMDQDKHCIGGYVIKLKSKNSAESNSSFYEHHDSTVSYFAVSGGGALWSELPIFVQKLSGPWWLSATDKRTDVWSRPSCIYTQIFSPKKLVFPP